MIFFISSCIVVHYALNVQLVFIIEAIVKAIVSLVMMELCVRRNAKHDQSYPATLIIN